MGRGKRVLVVDDNPLFAEGMTAVLERQGYVVTSCFSGRECLDRALDFEPHAIVSDHVMGKLTGLEVLRTLKRNAKTSNIPFIAITGFKTRSLQKEFTEAGAYAVISKSEAADRLVQVIGEVLGEVH